MTGIDFYLSLALCPFLNPDDAEKIRNLKNYKTECRLEKSCLKKFNFKNEFIYPFLAWQKKLNIEYFKEKLQKEKIGLTIIGSSSYPKSLHEISSPPPFLFYKGNIGILNDKSLISLAVVGSRKNSLYGQQVLDSIISPFCQISKCVIVSGLAKGIDAISHQIAINKGVKTVAVLGSGIFKNKIYPSINLHLSDEIISTGGLILSEFPPNSSPYKHNFPRRNRIISGLSEAVLVIEAQKRSGALITARFALEQNKDILAVPGDIFRPRAFGVNRLIQKGAYPIVSAEDLLNHFNLKS